MKLPIKHKFFLEIKEGKKKFEYRDAHLTLIDEETKETLRMDVVGATVTQRKNIPLKYQECLEDERTVCFWMVRP